MRKHILFKGVLAFIGLSLLACQHKETDFKPRQGDGPVFHASMEQVAEPDTRVYADENLMLLWHADDRISIFNKYTYNQQYRFDGETGANSGTFSKVPSETFVTGNALPAVYAVYPYDESTSITNGCEIHLTLPSIQEYSPLNFAPGANTMVSATEDNNLLFKNLGGYLAVKLYGDNVSVSQVTLRGNKGEKLAGKAAVTAPLDGEPTVVMADDATEEITVNCSEPVFLGSTSTDYTEFWFVLPPTDFEEGFTVTVTSPGGSMYTKSTDKSIHIYRSHLSRMSPIEVDLPLWNESMVPPDNEIWYVTKDGTVSNAFNRYDFGSPVISNTYSNGLGIVKCSGPIDRIHANGVWQIEREMIVGINLPETIESFGMNAFSWTQIKELRLPRDLHSVGIWAFSDVPISRFTGPHSSSDHHLLVIDDVVYATALHGVESYVFPEGITAISFASCMGNKSLKRIVLPESLLFIDQDAFSECPSLSGDIYLPGNLEDVGYRAFAQSYGITGYYGNPTFTTPDHRCLIDKQKRIVAFAGKGVEEYAIPEGIVGILSYGMLGAVTLKKLNLPESLTYIGEQAFIGGYNDGYDSDGLEEFSGYHVTADGKGFILDDVLNCIVPKCPENYVIPDGVKHLGTSCFSLHQSLVSVVCNDDLETIGSYAFSFCRNLREVVLSKDLQRFSGYAPFIGCRSLERIFFRSFFPPGYTDTQASEELHDGLVVYVPEETLSLYTHALQWSQFEPYMVGYEYDDIGEWNPGFYISNDFSHDGEGFALQHGSNGDSINIVLMGDGFSDRQIADGTYETLMRNAAQAFFSQEPYRNLQSLFSVFYVNVVSMTEGYDQFGQTLGTSFGVGTEVAGNDSKVIEYAKGVVSEEKLDDTLIIVLMNKDAHAGTCYMYDAPDGDYGRGLSIAYCALDRDEESFFGLVSHEGGGHGFAKLADEYAYLDMGAIYQDAIHATRVKEPYGWYKNIDFTGDPAQVKWSRFIGDERYAGESIGCYEGAFTYWTGVWRPTENSIMRYNTGGFNAPSRYAIWYRINKLAYGEEWKGTYEDFVAYDSINRTPSAIARRKARHNLVEKPLPPLAPPVVVKHSWREAR